MIVDYDPSDNAFILHTALNEKDLAKQVPGAAWRDHLPNQFTRGTGAWRVPASWPAYCAVNGIFAHTLTPTDKYRDWAQEVWLGRYGPLTELRFAQDTNIGDGPTVRRLWPLQRVAVQAMVWAERYIEMDDMGGGKTATTLAALKMAAVVHGEDKVFPALIVCPNKVRRSWRKIALEELGDGQGGIWPELRLEVMPKGKPAQVKMLGRFKRVPHDLDGGDCAPEICGSPNYDPCGRSWPSGDPDTWPQVLVINWEALHLLSRLEAFGQIELTEKDRTPGLLNRIPWKTVIADEAHRLKDRKSRVTRAFKAIAFGTPAVDTPPARFRWLLTGTPISKNAAEMWSLLNAMDDVCWPAFTRTCDRYGAKTYNGHGGFDWGGLRQDTAEEFQASILPYSIRRLREQFDPFKPHVTELTLTVPMDPKQHTAYHQLRKNGLAALDGGTLTATDGMSKANRMMRLASAYGEMVDKGRKDPITGEPLLDLLLKPPSNKVTAMLELVDDLGITSMPAPGENRSIVFGHPSRQVIGLCEDALKKARIPYSIIAGGMSDSQQELQERNFELGNTRIMLCVISAAKEGLNSLVKADTLVFLGMSDSNNDNRQFVGRIDRPGQESKKLTVIRVVSEGTLEEFIQVQRLEAKYANLQQIVSDARVLHTMLQWTGEGA